ncbi:class I SAM-dependent methyltransferase [Cellulosimicrobium arenosum]|uniref:Class I SAM-dependent methyltransferase n=1 Tax=Cellulosimicrobium arenosum TaxID=2708133 RepID=A0A927J1S0_9MICO|nr:class I SAM-dependent methyltransferase [Cellulosimicrobium arenosum]MBD8080035.1 class I SAM-dependent methyltransferase [Cellulosimicrobium arenosum]
MPDAVPAHRPVPPADASFEEHVEWARTVPVVGSDLSPVDGHVVEEELPWNYERLARELVASGRGPVLDLGTGDGEMLASLGPFPPRSAATEGWAPHLPVARRRLEPLGLEVRPVGGEGLLPFLDAQFAVVLDRHEAFDPDEVWRVLEPGGIFLTQQVDTRDGTRVNAALGARMPWDPDSVTLDGAVEVLREVGFVVDVARGHDGVRRFRDLGSLLWYLRARAWKVPELATSSPEAVARYEAPLRALHLHFAGGNEFVDEAPRFLVVARKPW